METLSLDDFSNCLSDNKQKLLAGDFNGDGFTDLLCHNQTGEMTPNAKPGIYLR